MRKMNWERSKWQEGFALGRGLFACPYCGESVYLRYPWGVTVSLRKDRDGLLISNCSECGMPVLRPREPVQDPGAFRKITESGGRNLQTERKAS